MKFSTVAINDDADSETVGKFEFSRNGASVRIEFVRGYITTILADIPADEFKKMAAFLTE